MNSRILTGEVRHIRYRPVYHAFRYPAYLYALDLDELETLDRELPGFGYNRFRPASVYDRDYLERGPAPIRAKLDRRLAAEGRTEPVERVILVTDARYFGTVFNPVSFYYCFGPDGGLAVIVAEVNNTFGERHLYIPRHRTDAPPGYLARYTLDKEFHVSPFNKVEGRYEFLIGDIREKLDIYVNLYWGDTLALKAWLEGTAQPMTRAAHRRLLLTWPLTPWLTMPRILKEAVKLYVGKKLPVFTKPPPRSRMTIRQPPPGRVERLCMRSIEARLQRIRRGRLAVMLPEGETMTFGGREPGVDAALQVREYRFFRRAAFGGDVGFGEAYMAGDWDSPDLTAVIRLIIDNRDRIEERGVRPGLAARAANRLGHLRRSNTRRGSARNIRAHYDLSNTFFETFLDETLSYSCAVFATGTDTLAQAQRNKMQRLIRLARIGPEHHVLEIGCGWGGFAVEAARSAGCRVTGITVSEAQYAYARDRVKAEGLQDRVEIRLQDYREIGGETFDRLVSIEMLEAVGHARLGTFFGACDRLLAPDGLAALQVITIPDQRYERYRRGCDWIQKYIFPGGMLPSLTALCTAMTRRSRFIVEQLENIGPHYARTLRAWRERFDTHTAE
ncbi:MAG: DUF1365 family protein, partial [Lentisphaerae bacterium]|nr:DUF1365 family protein [Lentisphaerota bacterium]